MDAHLPRRGEEIGDSRPQQGTLTRHILAQRLFHLVLLSVHAPAVRLIAAEGSGVEGSVVDVRHGSGAAEVAEIHGAGKNRREAVIVGGANGIELVVMAARTRNR